MAKSIRSKTMKRHRTYIRATVGEKVRTAHISAAAARLDKKKRGQANYRTLVGTKGVLHGMVDLEKAYFEAVVLPQREMVPTAAPVVAAASAADDDDDMGDDEEDGERAAQVLADLEEGARVSSVAGEKDGNMFIKDCHKAKEFAKTRNFGGSGAFSKRFRRRGVSARPPKTMVAF